MAEPPKPYDMLSLMFRVVELGGFEECAFYFPAGSRVSTRPGTEFIERGKWFFAECVGAVDDGYAILMGKAAIQCIAERRVHPDHACHITKIEPRKRHVCDCQAHVNLRTVADMSKLIGTHPSNEE